ncbi:unnamed protein product, partial [Ectocarpus fasciculatus]
LGSADPSITIPFEFPMMKQCDPRWTDDLMDTKTICAVGCLMSSTAMAIAGSNIPIKNISSASVDSTSKTLNQWLRLNDGYDGSNNLIETAVPNIDPTRIAWPEDAMHRENDLPYETVASYLEQGRIVIANVDEGGHFVLLTGYSTDGDTFAVNDPGHDIDTYTYSKDVVGYRIFDMVRK